MVVRYLSVVAVVYAATREQFAMAAGLAAMWVMLTVWSSHSDGERMQAGWLSLLFGQRTSTPSPIRARVRVPTRRPSLS